MCKLINNKKTIKENVFLKNIIIPSFVKGYHIKYANDIRENDREFINTEDKYVLSSEDDEIYETQDRGFATGKTIEEVLEKIKSDEKYFGGTQREGVGWGDPKKYDPKRAFKGAHWTVHFENEEKKKQLKKHIKKIIKDMWLGW